jgi:(p)ppGpp synthase/HD superfamily hydrolase
MKEQLSLKFEKALVLAVRLHNGQQRKGTNIPYMAHLLGVTALVLEDGGDEDQAIAALLHDAVEDQGGMETYNKIKEEFGDRIASIVDGCTDTYLDPKPPWYERKRLYLDHLKTASPDVIRVSLADKVHNARSILYALKQYGNTIWSRFNGNREGTLWYYHALVDIYSEVSSSPFVYELKTTLSEIEKVSQE